MRMSIYKPWRDDTFTGIKFLPSPNFGTFTNHCNSITGNANVCVVRFPSSPINDGAPRNQRVTVMHLSLFSISLIKQL